MSTDTTPHAFLGEEFLTWLWYRLETEGGEFSLSGGRSAGLSFDDYVCFAPVDGDETMQTLKAGTPTRSAEAATGLRSGRRLQEAKLILAMGELQWGFVLQGPTFQLRSIKLPDDDPEAADAGERSRERAANFVLVHELIHEIYGQFLRLRLRPGYLSEEAEQQANWIRSRS